MLGIVYNVMQEYAPLRTYTQALKHARTCHFISIWNLFGQNRTIKNVLVSLSVLCTSFHFPYTVKLTLTVLSETVPVPLVVCILLHSTLKVISAVSLPFSELNPCQLCSEIRAKYLKITCSFGVQSIACHSWFSFVPRCKHLEIAFWKLYKIASRLLSTFSY